MKHMIILEILRKIQQKPEYKKKLKIFLIAASVIFFVTTGLLIWGAVKLTSATLNYAQTISVGSTENLMAQVGAVKLDPSSPLQLGNFHLGQCWGAALALGDSQVWLQKPLADTFNNLSRQCFPKTQVTCEGESCQGTSTEQKEEWTRI